MSSNYLSNLFTMLDGTHKGWFTTVHVPNQIFGEVDPWFVAEFFGELPIDWEIIDGNAKQHKIQFNVNAKQPRLTTGWENLRSHYSWTENQKLYFYYYGGNQFFMVISNNPNDIIPSLFPPFHTLHNLVRNNPKFRMRLTSDNVTNDTMIIRQDFDYFIRSKRLFRIKLCGPLNNVVKINLLINSESSRRLKFAEGWKMFCEINQIVEGNVLEFEASGEIEYSHIFLVRVI
ncbi:hypothetical protein QL285_072877 [Trifolium repens]|nr:hypothetical protein QL285_072877 [Trifolium repens]